MAQVYFSIAAKAYGTTAIERELRRQKRLAYLRSAEGLVSDDEIPDTLDFVDRLRERDQGGSSCH